jgi:mannose-P-dolichol utilization defect protein 1
MKVHLAAVAVMVVVVTWMAAGVNAHEGHDHAHHGHDHGHHHHHHHHGSTSSKKPSIKSPFPLSLVLTDECLEEFLIKRNLFHRECLKKTISKGLGYAIVVGSGILKVPMVVNVVKQQSGLGLSIQSLMLETSALSASTAAAILKQHPFSIWGEALIIAAQNLVLIWLAEHYANGKLEKRIGLIGGTLVMFAVMVAVIPASWSNILIGYTTVCLMVSRLQQISQNFRVGHTGVLSIITQTLLVVGVIARLGTVLVETSDFATIASILLSLALNGILLGQVIMYWDASKAALAAATARKKA